MTKPPPTERPVFVQIALPARVLAEVEALNLGEPLNTKVKLALLVEEGLDSYKERNHVASDSNVHR